MKISKYISLFFTSAFLLSCQTVVQIDVPQGETLIIINGLVTDKEPAWVDVLNSVYYFDQNPNPNIDSATVSLFEDGIKILQFKQDTSGRYMSNYVGTIGKKYYVEVIVPSTSAALANTTWASNTEELVHTPILDTIYQDFLQAIPPFQDEGYYVFYEFTDPAGVQNNYRIRSWKNDTLNSGASSITAFDDAFFDGGWFTNSTTGPNIFPAIQLNGSAAKIGDKYKVEHSSISTLYMNYLQLVQEQTSQTGGIFDPPPALLEGNIYGVTSPSKTALGFFAASALSTLEYTITQ